MIATLTDYHDRPSWLASRKSGVGASEVSALFGLSPWQSMFSLWAEKTGLAEPLELDGEWLHWGQLLEEPIAQRYQAVTGRQLWTGGSPFCVAQHPTLPMFRCTPDRLVVSAPDIGKGGPGLLQVKNTAAFMADDWDEGPPPHIAIQVQAEMSCTGADWASVAVLIGGNQFRYIDVERNPSVIAEIEEQVAYFWVTFVEGKERPEIDGSAPTTRLLRRLHPNDSGAEVILSPASEGWLAQWEDAKARMAAVEKEQKALKDEAENKIREAIGAATFGVLPDGRRLTLKTTSRAGYTVEPTTYRTLRIESTKPKGKKIK